MNVHHPTTPIRRRPRRGVAAIEFGFWFPFMVVLLTGLMDFSWYMSEAQNAMQAARDGARTGASAGDNPSTTDVNESVAQAVAGAEIVLTSMGMSCDPVVAVPDQFQTYDVIRVSVSCPHTPLVGLLNVLPATIQYDFTMFLEIRNFDTGQ